MQQIGFDLDLIEPPILSAYWPTRLRELQVGDHVVAINMDDPTQWKGFVVENCEYDDNDQPIYMQFREYIACPVSLVNPRYHMLVESIRENHRGETIYYSGLWALWRCARRFEKSGYCLTEAYIATGLFDAACSIGTIRYIFRNGDLVRDGAVAELHARGFNVDFSADIEFGQRKLQTKKSSRKGAM